VEPVGVENEFVRINVVPELGCKIISIFDITHDHEWLWKDSNRPLKSAEFGTNYLNYDISGFDECFPNIGVSQHPLDPKITLPDHGDLWSIPWDTTVEEFLISSTVKGRSFPYVFSRQIQIEGQRIKFQYEVRNEGALNFAFMWSAHPLFNVAGAMSIVMNESPQMTKEFSIGGRVGQDGPDGYFGQFQSYIWPTVQDHKGSEIDLSQIRLGRPIADKVVLDSPSNGKIELRDLSSGRSLSFQLSPAEIPFIGICFNLGVVPSGNHPGTWVAIEPTSGCTDKLDDSYQRGAFSSLAPGESLRWAYSIDLE
jgi:galactose mutarotase-like enzyme